MPTDPRTFAAILAMALATFATRIGGVWLARRGDPPAFVARCLRHVPGAVITTLIVPAVVAGGLPVAGAGVAVVLVAARTRNVLMAAGAGAAALWLLRAAA